MLDVTDDEIRERIAANVNRLLEKKGWSGHDLAREARESSETIKRLRRGQNDVRVGVVVRVAAALKVPVDKLVEASELEPAAT